MQRLTYINQLNESVTFGTAPFVLGKLTGLGLPDVNVETLRGAYQHGDTAVGFRREARHLTLTLHLMGQTRADLYAQRLRLLRVLSPDRAFTADGGRGLLIYENDHGRWQTPAIPDGGLEAGSRSGNVQPSMKLSFHCEAPYWYATFENEVRFAPYANAGFQLPFAFPIRFGRRDYSLDVTNAGQVAAPVNVTITGHGETPRLLNETTGKAIALSAPLPVGSTLAICTDPARLAAAVTNSAGATESAFGVLSIDTPLAGFALRPGVNRLIYQAGGDGSQTEILVRWRAIYEGV